MSAQSLLGRVVAGASMPPLGGRILLRPAPAPRRRRRPAAAGAT